MEDDALDEYLVSVSNEGDDSVRRNGGDEMMIFERKECFALKWKDILHETSILVSEN